MKLIELLLQELPKRGGWPGAIPALVQNSSGCVYQAGGGEYIYRIELADDWMEAEVTCEKYFNALRALKPVWDGQGLPPVGCECEFYNGERYYTRDSVPQDGQKVKIVHHEISGSGIRCAVFVWIGDDKSVKSEAAQEGLFRPIHSETDERRENAVEALLQVVEYRHGCGHKPMSGWIYDAIAAGKIPGLRIE